MSLDILKFARFVKNQL